MLFYSISVCLLTLIFLIWIRYYICRMESQKRATGLDSDYEEQYPPKKSNVFHLICFLFSVLEME